MVLQTTSQKLSRRANSENTPPSASVTGSKSKVRNGIQAAASRRRRARATGGPSHPRYAVAQAKHKSTSRSPASINVEMPRASPSDVEMADATSAINMTSVSLPRYLSRPPFRAVPKEAIAAVTPELASTPLKYIHDGLECLGPHMLEVLAGVKAELVSNVLPTELSVVVNDISCDMPTHMLAVYAHQAPANAKRRVTLFPTHNVILATHCANLPILEKSTPTPPESAGESITIPVVPLCIPAPGVFPHLSTFLYTKRIDHLLATILPCPAPAALYMGDPNSESVRSQLQQFASKLATMAPAHVLLARIMLVNGLWRNACALGIADEKLWCAMDVAWEVLIHAIAISTGKQHLL
ncbi:hypothetical protein ID866_9504 [Astraeus odoratus]|nr:hypothetical protein ID866_9504 [Astraeus odoratus]